MFKHRPWISNCAAWSAAAMLFFGSAVAMAQPLIECLDAVAVKDSCTQIEVVLDDPDGQTVAVATDISVNDSRLAWASCQQAAGLPGAAALVHSDMDAGVMRAGVYTNPPTRLGDGPVYSCEVCVSPDAVNGFYDISPDCDASDANGQALPVDCGACQLRVQENVPACSSPAQGNSPPRASDCLSILQMAVGLLDFSVLCYSDVNNSFSVTAADALLCLQVSVGMRDTEDLNCRQCL
jgi:hypothetical protein